MDNLSLHIEYLLLHRECVIIPGVGAFINARIPAHFDADTRIWHPMRTEIRFNSAIVADDGLLANSFARKLRKSYSEARSILEYEIKQLRSLLQQEEEVSIGRIGSLRLNDGKLIFSPLKSEKSTLTELGLKSVAIDSLVAPAIVKNHIAEIEEKTTASKAEDHNITQDNSEEYRKLDFNRNYYIAINKKVARYVASVFILVFLALPMILPSSEREDSIKIDKAAAAPISQVESIIDSTVKQINANSTTKVEEQEIQTTQTNNDNIAEETIANTQPMRYFLIVGTFKSSKDAMHFIESEKGCGYELILLPTSTLCRVGAKAAPDKESLIKTLNNSSFATEFPGAWIWENK